MKPIWISTEKAAELLGISERHVRRQLPLWEYEWQEENGRKDVKIVLEVNGGRRNMGGKFKVQTRDGSYPAKFTVNLYTKEDIPEHYRIEFHFVSENNYQKVYISDQCSRGTEFDDG